MIEPPLAWLESAGKRMAAVISSCSIGRLPSNDLVLDNVNVSRRHALIHRQGDSEFFLVDLGSANGTFLNGCRIIHPVAIRDGDQVEIGPFRLSFVASRAAGEEAMPELQETIHQVKTSPCWLLVADIANSTGLAQKYRADELPQITGRWFHSCQQIVERSRGVIDKYLGDGFLSYWRLAPEASREMLAVIHQFAALQKAASPEFRVVVHYGSTAFGGMATMGGAMLFGPEVNFAFRMERLASKLALPVLLSQPAVRRLEAGPFREVGAYKMAGFDGDFLFFSMADAPPAREAFPSEARPVSRPGY